MPTRRGFLGSLLSLPVAAAASRVQVKQEVKKPDFKEALDIVDKELQVMFDLLKAKGWRNNGINPGFKFDTGEELYIFTLQQYPEFPNHVGRGSNYDFPSIDINDEDLYWQHWDGDMEPLGDGSGAESLAKHFDLIQKGNSL